MCSLSSIKHGWNINIDGRIRADVALKRMLTSFLGKQTLIVAS